MATEVKFEPNDAGIQAFLKSAEVQAFLRRKVEAQAALARTMAPGGVFIPRVRVGRTRAIGSVNAVNKKAVDAESRGRVLTKAMAALGGG